jgi:hypothetical protein
MLVQVEKRGQVRAVTRVVTEWIVPCMKDALAFNSTLLASEIDLKKPTGEDP